MMTKREKNPSKQNILFEKGIFILNLREWKTRVQKEREKERGGGGGVGGGGGGRGEGKRRSLIFIRRNNDGIEGDNVRK